MRWLSDHVLSQLQASVQLPDLAGTRYRAVRFLARGGMGTVWLAEDAVLGRAVALKILELDTASGELAARLSREAMVLAHLEHPGIVPIHDAGTLPDGKPFYCMKYVQGQSLDQSLPPTLPERLRLLQRIAEPLAFAHSRGIVHRDLKPGNIMVGAFGEVLIMDWGLAKITKITEDALHKPDTSLSIVAEHRPWPSPTPSDEVPPTAHGRILGTPGYMSPEQARGDSGLIDERTDVYALGAILRFMMTVKLPKKEASRAFNLRPLNAISEKAMTADPVQRYSSVQELSADVGRYLQGDPIVAYQEGVIERALRLYARHRTAVVLVLAYLIMRALFILFSRQ
ncbi:MAG TPA: serine/threonine-protein kinase [Candidatus Angelobacter sp.]|jgi:serine/threonine protein kinase|nr:serine/threonine-protein kinase [Candidatus Angelobacter sp.]